MTYNPNIPQPQDLLSDSQPELLTNISQLNSVYGEDHYAYTVTTANKGFHQKVTTPDQVTHLATLTNPKFYAVGTASAGVLQFSRGAADAPPTPLTNVMSSGSAINLPAGLANAITILDFAGIPLCIAELFVATFNQPTSGEYLTATIFYSDAAAHNTRFNNVISSSGFQISIQGANDSILKVFNSSTNPYTNVYWTLKLHRVN